MNRFFFYGTLIDADVRALVLGDLAEACTVVPALVRDWRCVAVRGATYPAILPRRGAVTTGVLSAPLPDAAAQRLIAYEGPEYEVETLSVDTDGEAVDALGFVAARQCSTSAVDWHFEAWHRRHKRRFIARLRRGELV